MDQPKHIRDFMSGFAEGIESMSHLVNPMVLSAVTKTEYTHSDNVVKVTMTIRLGAEKLFDPEEKKPS